MVWDIIVAQVVPQKSASYMHIEILRSFRAIANLNWVESGWKRSKKRSISGQLAVRIAVRKLQALYLTSTSTPITDMVWDTFVALNVPLKSAAGMHLSIVHSLGAI